MTDSWIYRYEAKGIQSFILATDKLKEIKGASSLVEELGEGERPAGGVDDGLFGRARKAFGLTAEGGVAQLARAVAGGATIEVPARLDQELQSFMAVWPLLVARHAPGLQVVQARVRGPRSRAEAWSELQANLRVGRSRLQPDLPEAGPLVLRAPRTGLPAAGLEATVAVDAAGQRKLAAAAQDRLGQRIGSQWAWVEDLDDLGHSYIGVLHLDGNDLGNRIKHLVENGQADKLRDFSDQLATATTAAVRTAVGDVLASTPPADGKLPGRPIVVGGDDVAFVLRGDVAIPFARRLLQTFESENRNALGGPLFATAGLALVHRHHPFRAAHDLAEELCKFSKQRLRGSANGQTPSSLAFYRLTSSASGRWSEIRQRELRGRSLAGESRWLSLCPYLLDPAGSGPTLDQLEGLAKAFADLPDGPVREWLGLLQTDPRRADAHYERFEQVQTQRAGHEGFQRLERALEALRSPNGWREQDPDPSRPEYASPLLDALTWLRMRAAT